MLTVSVQHSNDNDGNNKDDKVVLLCQGRIVHGDETAILCAAVHQQGRDVTLDLTGVEAIDAAGIGSLIALQASGIYLKLQNPSAPLRELLRVTQLDSIFEICETQDVDEMEGITVRA
jgi:anti-anti-sigma factor